VLIYFDALSDRLGSESGVGFVHHRQRQREFEYRIKSAKRRA
jgi:hypothetical protein